MAELIQFTESALHAVKRYRSSLQIPDDHFLRVGIRRKNETNKRLLIGFDTKQEKDGEALVQGIKVIYTPGEIFFFAGMKIDFKSEDGREGFVFVEEKS